MIVLNMAPSAEKKLEMAKSWTSIVHYLAESNKCVGEEDYWCLIGQSLIKRLIGLCKVRKKIVELTTEIRDDQGHNTKEYRDYEAKLKEAENKLEAAVVDLANLKPRCRLLNQTPMCPVCKSANMKKAMFQLKLNHPALEHIIYIFGPYSEYLPNII